MTQPYRPTAHPANVSDSKQQLIEQLALAPFFSLLGPELAARLGTVPDVVQRALGKLAADGLIEVDRREIRIMNRQALEAATE